jgi:stage II sporulation protein D
MTDYQSCSEKKHQHSTLKSFAHWFCGDYSSIADQFKQEQLRDLNPIMDRKVVTTKAELDLSQENISKITSPERSSEQSQEKQIWRSRIFPTKISNNVETQEKSKKVQNLIEVDSILFTDSTSEPKSFVSPTTAVLDETNPSPVPSTSFLRERHFLERCFFGDLLDQGQCIAQLNPGLSGAANRSENFPAKALSRGNQRFYQRWLRQFIAPPKLIPSAPGIKQRAIAINPTFPETTVSPMRSGWLTNLIQPMPMAMLGVLTLPVILNSTRLQPPEFKALNLQSAFNWSQTPRNAASNVVRLQWNEVAANIPSYLLLPGFQPPQGRFSQENLPQLQTAQQQPVLPPKPAGYHQSIPLRVAIAEGASSANLQFSGVGLITDDQGNLLGEVAPNVAYVAQSDGAGINLDRFYNESALWIKSRDSAGLIAINGKWYRGTVQLKARGQDLLVVNHVELEQYLYSVVGAEMMPSWPLDALKAQAVAARSYAIAHIVRPANSNFDIGATPQWQAYQGFEKEADSTRAAVDETRGLLLTYKGNIVETLYASSDSLVQEVHQGFGMSQEGAVGLADQRFNYQQILNYFYPGTRLAWLQLSQ